MQIEYFLSFFQFTRVLFQTASFYDYKIVFYSHLTVSKV